MYIWTFDKAVKKRNGKTTAFFAEAVTLIADSLH